MFRRLQRPRAGFGVNQVLRLVEPFALGVKLADEVVA
jgi:hypothetical protein